MSIKYSDSGFLDGADETKKLSFDVSGVTTGTTRTITMPDGDTKLYTGDGTSGQVLTSGGAGVAPTFQAAAGGGKVLKVTTETNSTRASLSSSTDHTLWTTATFTKDDASSDLVVSAVLSFRGNGSSWSNGLFCSIDGTEKGTDGSAFHGVQESGDNSSANATHLMVVNKTFSGIATGSHDIRFGWKTKDGTSTQAWGQFNPNSSDSVALHQMASHVTILEVE